jgi:murein L,D-transpeptidase YcbB/YkuD
VNIPAFQLWAINSPDDANALNMKVVVGKAEANQTPLLAHDMRYLEFMPYWNIPKNIMNKEVLPKMRNAQGYLSEQNIELIDKNANFYSEDPEAIIDSIKNDRVRARQLPGKKNPLGKVKFIFPNTHDVYLHDSPFRWAFTQDRRDFSHGCVRVEDAQKLAEFVLGHQQGWDKNSIEQAMANPKTQRVSLINSIPVLFLYNTVYAGQDKKLQFYPDIYGYDAPLQEAFKKQSL